MQSTKRPTLCRCLVWTLLAIAVMTTTTFYLGSSVEASRDDKNQSTILHQSSTILINQVKKLLLPPPPLSESLQAPIRKQSFGTSPSFVRRKEFLRRFIAPQSGFFVEAGAHNGEFLSMTLELEVKYNWTGLLVEPNPEELQNLVVLKRNAWIFPCALSRTEYSEKVNFFINPFNTGGSGMIAVPDHLYTIQVPSVPLYAVLKAMNVTRVDFLGLDVEGVEMDIIRTVSQEEILFRAVTLEYFLLPGGLTTLRKFMAGANYTFITDLSDGHAHDALFVHNSEFKPAMLASM